ncbi:YlzJ-like family protein [Cohnella massiliensis]|uniref:YlzJ-like family protein n=1 Tax=Cohnella massiliensis TaxID=1816691 RepID=UPI0009BA7D6D|nr:YlzJ-like family protein [Cohnella massiliensis]
MILYTCMPAERVLEGFDSAREPMVEVAFGGMTMLVAPVAPGIGRIVRLVSAPLDAYLRPELAPGQTIHFGAGAAGKQTEGSFSGTTETSGQL